MRFIDRTAFPEPAFWAQARRDPHHNCYHDLDSTKAGRKARADLRAHMVQAQKGLCAYCCCEISDAQAHNEHIVPESKCEQRSLDYDNLIASCNRPDSCGTFKHDAYDKHRFVSPLQADCEDHFRYREDGKLEGTTEEGRETVKALNLNQYELRTARRSLMLSLLSWANADCVRTYYREYPDGSLKQFADMLDQFCADGTFKTA